MEAERLVHALQSNAVQIAWGSDPSQVVPMLELTSPELLLLAWRGASRELSELLRVLRTSERAHKLPIIVLSPYPDTRSKVEALHAGADEYMATSCHVEELQAQIRALLRRALPASTALTVVEGLHLDPHTQQVTVQTANGPKDLSLSPQEFRLLHFLAQHPDRVHTREQLLERVWRRDVFVGERTVDVHVRKLRTAFAGTLCEDLIQTVWGAGYLLCTGAKKTRNAQLAKGKLPVSRIRLPELIAYKAKSTQRRPSPWKA